jgi:hypothetical protein
MSFEEKFSQNIAQMARILFFAIYKYNKTLSHHKFHHQRLLNIAFVCVFILKILIRDYQI